MTISEWMASKKNSAAAATAFGDPAQRRSVAAAEMRAYQELKSSIHRKLIDRLDLSSVAEISPEQLSGIIKTVVESLITAEGIPLTRVERERLVVEIQHETLGLGPAGAAAPGSRRSPTSWSTGRGGCTSRSTGSCTGPRSPSRTTTT